MIWFAAKFLYTLLFFSCVLIVWILNTSAGEKISINIVYFFTILLIPFVDMCIESIKRDAKNEAIIWSFSFSRFCINALVTIAILILAANFWIEGAPLMILWYFVFSFLYQLEPKISFFLSLFCFAYVGIFLLIDQKELAEKFSIHAYYLLIVWVILQIAQSVRETKKMS